MKEDKYAKSLAKNQVCAKPTETSVFEFSYLCVNSSLQELINMDI